MIRSIEGVTMYQRTEQVSMSDRLAQTIVLLKQYDVSTKEATQGLRDIGFSSVEDARRFVQVEMAKQLRNG
jgi:hypothetical protein